MRTNDIEENLIRYMTEDPEGNYFSFSKRIHEKAFAEMHKKLVLGSVPAFR